MKIGNKEIGPGQPCFIIAEIGINHNGSVEIAKKLIDAAVDAGCDAVKFQTRTLDVVYSAEELARPRESPFGSTNKDLKLALELGYKSYKEIDRYCCEKNIIWFASPWDCFSVTFLQSFDILLYKVASACLTDFDLLRAIASTKKPVILSTGMSTYDQVWSAVNFFEVEQCELAILSCTSTYPTKLEEVNLRKIETLRKNFDHPVGFSNHFSGPWPSLCAVAMGARMLEVHVTLSRSLWGSDQSASLEPEALKKLVHEVRDFEKALGDGRIEPFESEKPIIEKLRRFK